MSINWQEELDRVDEGTRPIAEGQNSFRIVEAKVVESSSGNTMIRTTVKVEGGPDDGKTAIVNLVFTFDNARAMKMTLRRLAALGIDDAYLKAENPSIEQIANRLLGRQAVGKVSHREWNGEMQNDVEFMGGGGGTPSVPGIPTTPSGPVAPPAPVVPPPPTVSDVSNGDAPPSDEAPPF